MNRKIKVAFVDFSANFHDKHSIYCLSAYLKKNGIECSYINNRSFSKTISMIRMTDADLLLYSAFSADIPKFIEFDSIVKDNLRIKSIIGGAGPTFEQSFFNSCTIDALCVGEGELAIVDFIENGFSASKNIITKKDSLPQEYFRFLDLDSMPFPDRDLVYNGDNLLKNMPNKQFLAGRGCPYMCTYCHNSIQNKMFKSCGPTVRKKNVSYLIDEINDIKHKYPLKLVVFQDDTFILNKKWLFEFCERFPREVGLPYTCNIRADLVNEEMISVLKESNCVCAYWSIESGNDFFRNELLKREMSKEQALETGHLLNKYNIPHRCGGMIGLPGEKFEDMLETLELNIKSKPTFGFASIFIPYAGLELTDYALKHNYLSKEALNELPKNTHLRSALNSSPDENLKIQKLTYLYPLFVSFPKLFYNRKTYKIFFSLPRFLLYILFNIFCGYKLSKLYKVKTSLLLKIAIMWRYFKTPF